MTYRQIASYSVLIVLLLIQCSAPKTSTDFDVAYLTTTPTIDGKLDSNLEYLDSKTFDYIWQFDNPVTDTAKVTYRMAYTPSHLYLYIETSVDSISYHRRGYLWGDGYKVLLAIPQKDSLTNELYELAYSPSVQMDNWERQRIMNYNFSQRTNKLSSSTKSQQMALEGKSGFETLIAWSDIEPYHPWFLDKMGYNIYFAKGIESEEHGYFTNGYSLVEDEGIWDEEIQKRNYKPIIFEPPTTVTDKVILAKPKRLNLQIGEPVVLKVASIDQQVSIDTIRVTFSDTASNKIISQDIVIQHDESLRTKEFNIEIGRLASGSYHLNVQHSGHIITNETIIIQPEINFEKISTTLQNNTSQLDKGTVNTLQFELNQIENKVTALKSYEAGEDVLEDWKFFQAKYQSFLDGISPYHNITQPYRRAFKSKYDDSYQPYSINLPDDYNPDQDYPLLVFMHGSGRDEQGLLDRPRSTESFIEIAPLARDIYRAYSSDESQKDIIEAIEDVTKHFSVDEDNIIIGGFSMGGYGALRTFYEHPKLYKGIAVFAGHPNLANEWLDGKHPNFLDDTYLDSFSNMPVFIYHGRKDAALDVGLIEKMEITLSKAGAIVTMSLVAENGHEYQDEKTNLLYHDWLNAIIKR